jgi:hypothetical protein
MSDWAAMINGVQPALAGLDMNMPGFVGYVRVSLCVALTPLPRPLMPARTL